MQLKGILGEITGKASSVNLAQQQTSHFEKGPATVQNSSAAGKSIDSLASGNTATQIRLDNGVKLHELSRQ